MAIAEVVAAREAEHAHSEQAGFDGVAIAAAPALDGPGIVEPAHLARPDAGELPQPVRRTIARLIVVAFVGVVAFSGFEATFSLLAGQRFGLDLAQTAAVFAAIGVVLVAVQGGLVGPVTHRLGEYATMRFGLLANALGLGLLAVDLGWAGLVPALLLLTVGQGLLTPTLSAAVSGLAGRQRGQWLGWQQSAGGLARVIGPLVAGSLFEFSGVGVPYALGAVLALLALALLPAAVRSAGSPTVR